MVSAHDLHDPLQVERRPRDRQAERGQGGALSRPVSEWPPSGARPLSEWPPSEASGTVSRPVSEWPPSGARPVSQWPPSGARPVSEWPPSGARPFSKWPPSGARPVSEWPPSGARPVSEWPPSGARPVSEWPPSGARPVSERPPSEASRARPAGHRTERQRNQHGAYQSEVRQPVQRGRGHEPQRGRLPLGPGAGSNRRPPHRVAVRHGDLRPPAQKAGRAAPVTNQHHHSGQRQGQFENRGSRTLQRRQY